jgi:dienelactone hydrolase
LLALVSIGVAIAALERAMSGITVRTERLGSTPVTVFAPAAGAPSSAPAPVVLVAHGFAGSQQLMQPFAVTLARNGFVAITFDFPGHGRNGTPMRGGLVDQDASLRMLLASMVEMGAFARDLARAGGASGRYAVVGHSMASDIVVRHAQAHADEIAATVGVSLFAPSIDAATPNDRPPNLLVIDGALEPAMMAAEALRVVGRVAGPDARLDTTYGRFADGTARRATLAPGAEHIGVLYSAHTLGATRDWLLAAFDRQPAPTAFVDARGGALALLFAGIVALAWPLARLLPRVASAATATVARSRWWGRRGQWTITIVPAVVTPLVLWKLPSDLLPILLGDYLVLHFALYGLLTLAIGRMLGRGLPTLRAGALPALLVAVLAVTGWALLAIGVPLDRYMFNLQPEAGRLPIIAVLCAGTLPYFLADEWLTRGPAAARGAYFASKLAFLLSLVLAIALNPWRLFFLAIIVPAILVLFVVYGLFSRWTYRGTGHPAVAAVANALAFGWFIAVVFPLVR